MAMIRCPECGRAITDQARKCVHCGKVLVKEKRLEEEGIRKNGVDCGKVLVEEKAEPIKSLEYGAVLPFKDTVCPNCGEKLPDDSNFCIKCGTKLDRNIEINETPTKKPSFFQKNRKKIGIGIVTIITVLLVMFIINAVQASNLKKELKRDWQKVEGENGSYILCILDFSDDEIEYRLETGYAWMDTTVATYDYKVVSGNKIKVLRYSDDWETINLKFNTDKTVMIASPAITSIDDTEIWINID